MDARLLGLGRAVFMSWHPGYWGQHVGYYGGVNYGFGYMGIGFVGGMWAGGAFRYNTAVMRVNETVIHNTYVDRDDRAQHDDCERPARGVQRRPGRHQSRANRAGECLHARAAPGCRRRSRRSTRVRRCITRRCTRTTMAGIRRTWRSRGRWASADTAISDRSRADRAPAR